MMRGAVEHAVKNVSIVDLQVTGGLEAHRVIDESLVACYRQLRRRYDIQHRPVANDCCAPGNQTRRTAAHYKAADILRILVIVGEAGEINRPQYVLFIAGNGGEQQIVPEVKDPIEVISVLQANPVVVPDVVGIDFRTLKCEVLPFRPPIEMVVLGHVADVVSRNETGVGVKVCSYVLVLQLVGKAPARPEENAFVVLAEGVANGRRSNRTAGAAGIIQSGNNFTRGIRRGNHAAKPRTPILAQAD